MQEFLAKYVKKHIPDESTLRKNYLPRIYDNKLEQLREKAKDSLIWVSVDETIDVEQRMVVNFVFGVLTASEHGKSYVLNIKEVDRCNSSVIASFVNDSLSLLWPDGIKYQNVLFIVTDAAPYMIDAFNSFKYLYPNMIHMTCMAHGIHRVCEFIRKKFPLLNTFISSMKKVFRQSAAHRNIFKELTDGLPLPPQTIVTRWGSWLTAVHYYSENFEAIENVLNEIDSDDSESVATAKSLLENVSKKNQLKAEIIYVNTNFYFLCESIKELEFQANSIDKNIEIVERCVEKLNILNDETYSEKMRNVLEKNRSYPTIKKIKEIISNREVVPAELSKYKLSQISAYQYIPFTSSDVERNFSRYKNVLRSNRRSFDFENLKKLLVVQCNSNFDK